MQYEHKVQDVHLIHEKIQLPIKVIYYYVLNIYMCVI